MRPIPAPRIGDSHGLLRAIEQRGRLRTDEFVTEFSLEQLFPPDLENALGRMRHFISYARSAGLVKEDRGVVELTEVGKRYVRAGDDSAPFDVSPQQAEWLRRQLREKHMTDSIFHGMAIGLSLLASVPPGTRISTLDFGRSLAYLGRAGWDNENTFQIQGERYLTLLTETELIDGDHRLTATGEQVRGELTLPVHMSLLDIAAQLNPAGAEGVRADAAAEWSVAPPEPASAPAEESGYHDVVPGEWAPGPTSANGESAPAEEAPGPPVPPADIWETSGPEDATKAIPAAHPPVVPRSSQPGTTSEDPPAAPAEEREKAAVEPAASAPEPAAVDLVGGGVAGGDAVSGDAVSGEAAGGQIPGRDVAAGGIAAGEDDSRAEDLEAAASAPAAEDVVAAETVVAPTAGEPVAAPPASEHAAAEPLAASPAAEDVAAAIEDVAAPPPAAGPPADDVAALGGVAAAEALETGGAAASPDIAALGGATAGEAASGALPRADAAGAPSAGDVGALGGAAAAAAGAPSVGDVAALGGAAAAAARAAGATPAGDVAALGGAAAAAARAAGTPSAGDAAALGAAAATARAAGAPPLGDVAALGGAAADARVADAPSAGDVAALGGAAAAAARVADAPSAGDVAALGGAAAAAARVADVPSAGDVAALGGAAAAAARVAGLGGAAAEAARAAAPALGGGGLRSDPGAFLDPVAIRSAAEAAGLRLPDSVYANVAAALGAGKHVLLAGAPGAGKTSLALAVARAAAQAGRAHGATLVTARYRWAELPMLVESAKRGRWVIVDELDRARLDRALGELSSFLAGLPVLLADGEEAAPDPAWRIVATAASAPRASAALLRRFAVVEVPPPSGEALVHALHAAAGGNETAAAAIGRLLPLAEIAPLGAGVFLDAARHAAARHAAVAADEATLTREAFMAYVAPLLGEMDDDDQQRVREILGDG